MPDTGITGEPIASLLIVTLPWMAPMPDGAKVTFSFTDSPGPRINPDGTPLAVMPAPEIPMLEIVTYELLEFWSTVHAVLDVPMFRVPKDNPVGVAVSSPGDVLTVSIAGLLATLPKVLLTTTVNMVPSCDACAAGVVYVEEVAPGIANPFCCH